MNKIKGFLGGIKGTFGLYTDIEETDSLCELFVDRRDLAAYRG